MKPERQAKIKHASLTLAAIRKELLAWREAERQDILGTGCIDDVMRLRYLDGASTDISNAIEKFQLAAL